MDKGVRKKEVPRMISGFMLGSIKWMALPCTERGNAGRQPPLGDRMIVKCSFKRTQWKCCVDSGI